MAIVLVADDEPGLLESIMDVVRDLGHEVHGAVDGDEAFALARKLAPNLIITDHMMPDRTGVDLIRALRVHSELCHVPVILVSAARPQGAEEAWRFLSKPFSIDALEKAIAEGLLAAESAKPRRKAVNVSAFALAREEMLARIAHEIINPVTVAKMNAELLERGQKGEKRAREIIRQLKKIEQLVHGILDAARMQDGEIELRLEHLNLAELVQNVVHEWTGSVPDVPISVGLENEDEVWVQADRERVQLILNKLLSNAVTHGRSEKGVAIGVGKAQLSARVVVRDFGPGVPRGELTRVFDRYHHAHDGARGLGLHIAAASACALGGNITVESDEGQGAVFTVELPLARRTSPPSSN